MQSFKWILPCLLFVSPAFSAPPDAKGKAKGGAVIDWKEADKHVGKKVVLEGAIIAARNVDRIGITFLNFDAERTFTAFVREKNYKNFSEPPEEMYLNKIIRIDGKITEYKGKAQIEILKPSQVEIVGDAPSSDGEPEDGSEGETEKKDEPPTDKPADKPVPSSSFTLTIGTYNVMNLFDEYDDPYTEDEGTPAKPMAEQDKLARVIKQLNADVLALEEVENRYVLERFVHDKLVNMNYQEIVCIDGNDGRGIDVALLSRFPILEVTSHRHMRFKTRNGEPARFNRDLLQVRIAPKDADPFDVFVVHLKSKRGGDASTAQRDAEADQVRAVLDGVLKRDPGRLFAICGDFNDEWTSPALQAIRGKGPTALSGFLGDLPKGTVTYNINKYASIIDFILCSPAMGKRYVEHSYQVTPGTVENSGTDHNPVTASFRF